MQSFAEWSNYPHSHHPEILKVTTRGLATPQEAVNRSKTTRGLVGLAIAAPGKYIRSLVKTQRGADLARVRNDPLEKGNVTNCQARPIHPTEISKFRTRSFKRYPEGVGANRRVDLAGRCLALTDR